MGEEEDEGEVILPNHEGIEADLAGENGRGFLIVNGGCVVLYAAVLRSGRFAHGAFVYKWPSRPAVIAVVCAAFLHGEQAAVLVYAAFLSCAASHFS